MCVFYGLPGECEGTGAYFERPIRIQVLRGPFKLCQVCGSTSWVGSRDFYAHIWELWRHFGHMGCMLDSDWSRKILLRCDWLGLLVASITTVQASGVIIGRLLRKGCFVWITHYYVRFALSLGRESLYIFSKFNSLNTDTALIQDYLSSKSIKFTSLYNLFYKFSKW